MPQQQKKERTLLTDVDNLKSRKELRQTAHVTQSCDWGVRFWAWLIDMIVVGVLVQLVFPVSISALFQIDIYRAFVSFMAILLYWSVLDSNGRQSIGKRLMDLKVVDHQGNSPSFSKAFVNAFGKSLLLPIDVAIGLIIHPGENRRLFNSASETIVVSTSESFS